ncbi:MAG: YraN family protein [Pirellulales bacterium]
MRWLNLLPGWLRATSSWQSSTWRLLWRSTRESIFPTLALGERGERAAERFLRGLGYRIVDRRVRWGHGEIDLVAVDGQTIVFVEVKTRRSKAKGHPADAVDARKQRQLTRLALAWLKKHRLLDRRARFDVVAITWPREATHPTIEHIRNAFEAVGLWQLRS